MHRTATIAFARLRKLEEESPKLKALLADLPLDKQILQDVRSGRL